MHLRKSRSESNAIIFGVLTGTRNVTSEQTNKGKCRICVTLYRMLTVNYFYTHWNHQTIAYNNLISMLKETVIISWDDVMSKNFYKDGLDKAIHWNCKKCQIRIQ